MLRIVVTGGTGFIGGFICETLLQQGHHVICVDNFYTGSDSHIKPFKHHPQFHLIPQDILDPLELQNIDQIYHLACPASPIHYQKHPIKTLEVAVVGTLNMLRLAQRNKARFLLASTSEVYGDPLQHPQTETYLGNVNPIGIRACYDEGKRAAETLTMDFFRAYHLSIKIARIFNTYGPRMHAYDGRVISNFVVQALSGNPITIYGHGSQTRSFCYVSDMVNG